MLKQKEQFADRLREMIEVGDSFELRQFIAKRDPDEIAEILDFIGSTNITKAVLDKMSDADAAETLMLIYPEMRSQVIDDLPPEKSAKFVSELPSDDAADLLDEMEEPLKDEVLSIVPDDVRQELVELSAHSDESAGSLMAHEVEHLPGYFTVAQAIADMVRFGDDIEEIFQIFITDENEKLLGSIAVQRLLLSPPAMRLSEIAKPIEVVIPVDSDVEFVADLFRRKDIVSAPVVDDSGKLLGKITIDDVLDVVDEEATEDIFKMFGIRADEESVVHNVWKRLPWFFVLLFGGIASGFILHSFAETLSQAFILLAFIPIITSLAGFGGLQSSTVLLRRIALSRWGHSHHSKAISREIFTEGILGLLCGVIIAGIGVAIGQTRIGIVSGAASFFALLICSSFGSVFPVVIAKLGKDPAISNTAFITAIGDIIGILTYLSIVSAFLN
jgi:magnesium transporter